MTVPPAIGVRAACDELLRTDDDLRELQREVIERVGAEIVAALLYYPADVCWRQPLPAGPATHVVVKYWLPYVVGDDEAE